MTPPPLPRLLMLSIRVLRAFRLGNLLIALFFVAVLVATLPGAELIQALIARKYGSRVDVDTAIAFMQVTLVLGLPVCVAVDRLLAALRAILRTVEQGDPFVRVNAARLRTIGWMLLAIQIADLLFGLAHLTARSLHLDYATWQPSFTGWLTVLVVFVLAQVFERGAAMRDDLDGTI